MSQPIKNREAFFDYLEEGLQAYFDNHDRYWGGILHLTVGVKCGEVGGILKSENMLSYEGFTLHRVETILKYVLPRYVSRDSVPYAIAAVLDELRVHGDEPCEEQTEAPTETTAPEEQPRPKKHRTRGRKRKQK